MTAPPHHSVDRLRPLAPARRKNPSSRSARTSKSSSAGASRSTRTLERRGGLPSGRGSTVLWFRRSESARVHWLEYATGVVVFALIVMQAFRPGLPQGIDPRALIPSFDAIAIGRAALERIVPQVPIESEPEIAVAPESVPRPNGAFADETPVPAKSPVRRSGYVEGYAQLHLGGSGSVTIDNSANDADVFVNLVRLDDADSVATRVMMVAAGDRFTVYGVQRGRYELRYRDLRTGVLDRTEPFVLTERRTRHAVTDGRTVISIGDRR